MSIGEIIALIAGIGGFVTALLSLLQKAGQAGRDQKVTEAANVIKGYVEFCDDLRDRIKMLVEQVKGYEAELTDLREAQERDRKAFEDERRRLLEEHAKDREQWDADRADLLRRIAERDKRIKELEKTTAILQASVNDMVALLKKYEKEQEQERGDV